MCSVLINKIRKYFPAEAITRTVDKALFWHRLQGITEEDNKQKGLVSKINLPGSQRSATRTSWRARNQRRAAQRVPSDRHTAAPAKPPAAHRANQPRDNGRAAPKKRRLSSARRCWGNGPGLPCSTTTSNKDEAMPQERRAGQVPRHSPEGRAGSPPPQSAALRWAPGTARPGAGDGGRGLRPPHRTETRRENGSRKRDNPPRRGNRRRPASPAARPRPPAGPAPLGWCRTRRTAWPPWPRCPTWLRPPPVRSSSQRHRRRFTGLLLGEAPAAASGARNATAPSPLPRPAPLTGQSGCPSWERPPPIGWRPWGGELRKRRVRASLRGGN